MARVSDGRREPKQRLRVRSSRLTSLVPRTMLGTFARGASRPSSRAAATTLSSPTVMPSRIAGIDRVGKSLRKGRVTIFLAAIVLRPPLADLYR